MSHYDRIKAMERVVRAADRLASGRDVRVPGGHALPVDEYLARWGALVLALDEYAAALRWL